jgi:PAS domain S-box-containing protein
MKLSSLRYRIAATIFVLEAVMMVSVLWITLSSSLESTKKQVAATEAVTLKNLAELGRIAFLNDEYNDLQPFMENVVADPHVLKAILVNEDNIIYASSDTRDFGQPAPAFSGTDQTYWRGLEISNATGKLGSIWLRFSNAELEAAFAQTTRLGIIVAIAGMVVIAFAGMLLGILLTRRLERLSHSAAQFAQGNLAAHIDDISGNDEFAELAHTFNQMADEIGSTLHTLKESELRFRNIFEHANDAIFVIDIDTSQIIDVNRRACEMLEYDHDELLQTPISAIHPDGMTELQEFVTQVQLHGSAVTEELTCVTKHGTNIVTSISASLLEMDGRSLVLAQVRDISERKQSERALQRVQKMDAIGQLTGGIAHDFNNILGIILGNLSLLERELEVDEKLQKRFDTIKHSAERAADLTRKLLGFSRKDSSGTAVCNLNGLIEGMENLLVRSLTPQVAVQKKLAEDLWLTEIDPGDCEDALLNLVLNARDAMSGSGRLTIETSNCTLDTAYCAINPGATPGDYVVLSVSDDGEGMSLELQQRIFEPFFTTKEQGKGTGLGMAMVFGFVKRSGGYIKVYSEPGIGTTIRLHLPRAVDSEQSSDIKSPYTVDRPGGHETILVVDDEIALLELVEATLTELGYTVYRADNAHAAMDILDAHPEIDLLFSDVVMPGNINGYQLAEIACEQQPSIKVVLTSGYTDMAMASNGQAKFNADLLTKPYTLSSLANKLRQMLD